jgi:hypothetical protein
MWRGWKLGANARRRSALKVVARNEQPATVRTPGITKTMRRLKMRMQELDTLAQFEQIINAGHPDNREHLRQLMTPMLPAGLPCCGQGLLAEKTGRAILTEQHSAYCPTRTNPKPLVTLS